MSKVIICPTVTAFEPHEYREQMELAESLAERVHIDLMDGEFTPSKSPALNQIWLSDKLINDIHLMYRKPHDVLDSLLALKPHLLVVHAEAELDHSTYTKTLQEAGIKAGLALLPETSVESVAAVLTLYDHVLVFGGKLGFQGGQADLAQLNKINAIRQMVPTIEISWDGGINDKNATQLTDAGVDVLNVGGFIQKSSDPQKAFQMIAEAGL